MKFVFPTEDPPRYVFPTHANDLVMDRSESLSAEVFITVLRPGQTSPLHKHDDMEQIFYVIEGRGVFRIGKERQEYPVKPGDVVRIPTSTLHSASAMEDTVFRYLAVDCFSGGRPKDEPTYEQHIRTVCRELGWDFASVLPARIG